MRRDMFQIAETASVNRHYDINLSEIRTLMSESRSSRSGCFKAIYTAFNYGYEMGKRALKAEMKKTEK